MTDRPTQAALADLKDAKRLTAELISNWDDHHPFDAQATLRMHPQLADVKSVVLDLAHEEFCQRLEKGESVPVEEFAARFPNYQDSLAQLLGLQQALNADLHLLGDGKNVAWPAAGESLFDFELNEEIGRGAFSRVFLGTEPALGGRQVVLKVSRSISSEAATLGKLQHPNIVPVFSVRSDPRRGLAAICMPFLSRTTLFDLLDAAYVGTQSPLSSDVIRRTVRNANGNRTPANTDTNPSSPRFASYIDCAIQISVQLADALAYTHALGIFHRDIKPSNVLITETADALLFDFNLAFARENAVNRLGGTLPYMSPEQLDAICRGPNSTPHEEIGARSDVFSLGATLYELLCGRMPFGRLPNDLPIEELAQQLLLRQRNGATPLRVRNPNINHNGPPRPRCYDANCRPSSAGPAAPGAGDRSIAASRWPSWLRASFPSLPGCFMRQRATRSSNAT